MVVNQFLDPNYSGIVSNRAQCIECFLTIIVRQKNNQGVNVRTLIELKVRSEINKLPIQFLG